jgi:hypothetical protein
MTSENADRAIKEGMRETTTASFSFPAFTASAFSFRAKRRTTHLTAGLFPAPVEKVSTLSL